MGQYWPKTARLNSQKSLQPCKTDYTFSYEAKYLSGGCKGNPSLRHSILGVGLPLAMHFSDTDGPGCIVCSENLKSSTGRASRRTRYD